MPVRKKAKKTHKPARKAKKSAKPKKILSRPAKKAQKKGLKHKLKKPAPAKKRVIGGTVLHYFTNISVGVVKVNSPIKIGDRVSIEGATTNFKQKVESIQKDGKPVSEAHKGDSIGLKVRERVREKDSVFII